VYSSPVVTGNGIVYVGADNGKIFALNATTGAEIWIYTTGGMIRGSFAVINNSLSILYVGSYDNKIYAIFEKYFPWDVTGDGYVGIDDIVAVAEHFGTQPDQPNWHPKYDINFDDYVGIDDIVATAEHFGQTPPP
jgi:outer membrane protein assembly factor BamB